MRKVLTVTLMVFFTFFAVLAQSGGSTKGLRDEVYTPEKGSAERKAIMDALRVPVEKKLNQPVILIT